MTFSRIGLADAIVDLVLANIDMSNPQADEAVEMLLKWRSTEDQNLPHSRACGLHCKGHGTQCHWNCPTCHGKETW